MNTEATPIWDRLPPRALTPREVVASFPAKVPGGYMAASGPNPTFHEYKEVHEPVFEDLLVETNHRFHALTLERSRSESNLVYGWTRVNTVSLDAFEGGAPEAAEALGFEWSPTLIAHVDGGATGDTRERRYRGPDEWDSMLPHECSVLRRRLHAERVNADERGPQIPRVISELDGVSERKAGALVEAGFETVEDLREATQGELASVNTSASIGRALAARIKAQVGDAEDDGESDYGPHEHAQVVGYDFERETGGDMALTVDVAVPCAPGEVNVAERGAAQADVSDRSETIRAVGSGEPADVIGRCEVELHGSIDDVVRSFLASFPPRTLPEDLARAAGLEGEQVEQVAETERRAAENEAAFGRAGVPQGGVVGWEGPRDERTTGELSGVAMTPAVKEAIRKVAKRHAEELKNSAPVHTRK